MLFFYRVAYAQNIDVFDAIANDDLSQVEAFLANGGDVNTKGLIEQTPLHFSLLYENTEMAMLFIEFGVDINKRDSLGRTAFYWALIGRNEKVAKALIERNAEVIPNSNGSRIFRPVNLYNIVSSQCISDPPRVWINAQTHSEFLPYIERYLSVKEEIIGQSQLDYPVKVLFYRSESEVWRQVSQILTANFTVQGTATCILNSRHILVNYDAWVNLSSNMKEVILFHELGHCDLSRDHTEELQSIMNTNYTLSGVNINENSILRQELHEELFSKQGGLGNEHIEYPIDLKSDDPEVCPTKTKLYLDGIDKTISQ